MKRLTLILTAMVFAVSGAIAQPKVESAEAALSKKLTKLQADAQNDKKNTKAALWLDLGKTYVDAAMLYSTGLYESQDINEVIAQYGQGVKGTEMVGDKEYVKYSYPTVDIFFDGSRVAFWRTKKTYQGADNLQLAAKSYSKAYEVEKTLLTELKAGQGLSLVADIYKQDGGNYYKAQEYAKAAGEFVKAVEVMAMPPLGQVDSAALYNAGFLYTIAGDFDAAANYLEKAKAVGYDSNGEIYYYLFHAYAGKEDFENAKRVLLEGLGKYPSNMSIIESLITLYGQTGDDPRAIEPYIAQALASDPNNPELYLGMGRIYDKMDNTDKAIEAFQKAVNLNPENFYYNFNLGLMYLKAADNFMVQLNNNPNITNRAAYDQEVAKLNEMYAKSLPAMEKAYSLKQDKVAAEFLRTVYFRLRDQKPEYMQLYEKYNAITKEE